MASPEAQKKAAAAQDKAWDKLAEQFPNADRSKFVANVEFAKKPHRQRRHIFQRQPNVTAERVQFRQKIMEPTPENRARCGASGGLSLSAVTATNKNSVANPSG